MVVGVGLWEGLQQIGSRQVDLFVLQVLRRVGEADRPTSRLGRAKKDQVVWPRESEQDSTPVSEQKEKQVSAVNCCERL